VTNVQAAPASGSKIDIPWLAERAMFVLSRAGIAGAFAFLFIWLPIHAVRPDVEGTDLYVYYQAAQRLAHGQPLYTGLFIYPPFFAALIRPAAAVPLPVFQVFWYALIMVGYWAYAAGLARLAFGRLTWDRIFAVGALVILVPGTNETMSLGNVDLLIWATIVWSIPSGRGLAFGACLKIYPAFVALPAFVRDLKMFWRQLGVAVAFTAFVVGFVGPHVFVEWWRAGLVVLPDCAHCWWNVSLSMAIVRHLGIADLHGSHARLILTSFPLLAISSTVLLTRKWRPTAAASIVLVVAAWSAPVCWDDWLPIALIPLAAWVRGRLGIEEPR
jgi:hypothetical protein